MRYTQILREHVVDYLMYTGMGPDEVVGYGFTDDCVKYILKRKSTPSAEKRVNFILNSIYFDQTQKRIPN